MDLSPAFNFRDVLRAPARALSAKQILVMTLFLMIGLAIYDLFTYMAYAIDGESLSLVFSTYGFFPFDQFAFGSKWAQAIYVAGAMLGVLSIMTGFLGVAAINIEAVRGNRFFSARQAIRFAFRRLPQIFLSELAIVLFVAFIILLFFLLGLVSRVPWVGEWVYVLLFALPNFVIALFSIFILLVFSTTILLLPSAAAADRQGETFNAILETFSTILLQPFRWAGYTLYALVAAKVFGFVFAYFAFRAVEFMTWAASLGGGERLIRLVKSGLAHLPMESDLVREMFNIFPGVSFGVDLRAYVGYLSSAAVSYLMAFMLFLVFASIIGYMLAIVAAGQARGYVALRYIKDDYNIAEEESLFFKEEPVNEKVDETDLVEPSQHTE